MKKASAIVIYSKKENRIINLSFKYNQSLIDLTRCVTGDKFNSFNAIYQRILTIAKMNNTYFASYNEFGAKWYDIQWIDINNPFRIDKYGFRKEV